MRLATCRPGTGPGDSSGHRGQPIARAAGRDVNELEIQVIATTLVWALTTAARIWQAEGYARPLQPLLDDALAVVEHGLRLEQQPTNERRRRNR